MDYDTFSIVMRFFLWCGVIYYAKECLFSTKDDRPLKEIAVLTILYTVLLLQQLITDFSLRMVDSREQLMAMGLGDAFSLMANQFPYMWVKNWYIVVIMLILIPVGILTYRWQVKLCNETPD